jgi:hypothetical protein
VNIFAENNKDLKFNDKVAIFEWFLEAQKLGLGLHVGTYSKNPQQFLAFI